MSGGFFDRGLQQIVFLKVEGLKTYFDTEQGTVKAVDGVDFEILGGETGSDGRVGLREERDGSFDHAPVPESSRRIAAGHIWFKGRELT